MNRRIMESPIYNLPTYPGEHIYIPDMLVAIVALSNYAHLYNGRYQSTVDTWVKRAQTEWIDRETGLLASFLEIFRSPNINVLKSKKNYAIPAIDSYNKLIISR